MAPVKTRSTSSKHRQDRGYKADPDITDDDDDFYGMRELKHQLAGLNLQLKDTMGDGNCLFRACADQFFGSERDHAALRSEVCEYIGQHAEHFSPFLDNETVDAHVSLMRKNGTFGGNIELVAFARLKRVDVRVYQPGYIFVIEGVDVKKEGSTPGERPIMHIAYHSWEHYSSIRNIDGPYEGLPEINPRLVKQMPLAKLSNKDPPRSLERLIMNVSGVQDLELVRVLLQKHHGNVDRVYDDLAEESSADCNESTFSSSGGISGYVQDGLRAATVNKDISRDATISCGGVMEINDKGTEQDKVCGIISPNSSAMVSTSCDEPPDQSLLVLLQDAQPALPTASTNVPVKGSITQKRISSREKKELAKRNQKLNRKIKSKLEANS
ncbi:hypothetical protein BGZ98_006949 [Dissophora globulifera]|nr:hypothetical protein BGZ98_006949 [Dissophora globulifera]